MVVARLLKRGKDPKSISSSGRGGETTIWNIFTREIIPNNKTNLTSSINHHAKKASSGEEPFIE